ncbi:MAG TPA: RsmB/NOP family class I SAM-dependent RNA methyltransferase [Solirubrobacterales bacterium]|nr:RsmB/NOP family class I SAM-dependent RNA methyltransferase [Solirubrobacterales bacterium]
MSAPTPARRAAYETLRRVFEEDAWADRALPAAAARLRLEGRDRAQAQALAYGAVQRRGTTDHLVKVLADRPAERIDAPLLAALRLGLYELLFASGGADHAAVDQAVALAKGRGGHRHGAGLVNAVLRRAARERERLLASLDDADPAAAAVAHSVPPWLAELWWRELGPNDARALLAAVNEPPEQALRANGLRGDRDAALAALHEAGVKARPAEPGQPPAPAGSIVITGGDRGQVEGLVAAGIVVPQSRASAAVVEVLAPEPGERVLDLCAAPGAKAAQIAAAIGGAGAGLVAVERHPGRARELRATLERAGAGAATVECRDAAGPPSGTFDAVLVDPPCSGLGTLASRPDARWRRDPKAFAAMADQATRILERALAATVPGGRVVYSTCTISRDENEEVATAVPARVADLGADPALAPLAAPTDSRFLQTRNDRDGTDGFFVAALEP